MLINDKNITVSVGSSRQAKTWQPQTMLLSAFYERLRTPARGTETLDTYFRLPKAQQDTLKDVGGFVGGTLHGGRRKADCVAGRDLLTLDLDHIPTGGTDEVLRRVGALGCGYAVYSTRKHRPDAPRLRVLLPLDHTCTADEYEPLARKMAEFIGLDWCDPSTFEASRLMYWPSCCADSQYLFTFEDKPLLSVEGVLAMYQDWRDVATWPEVPGTQQSRQKLVDKQEDPAAKTGLVGAFCRVYDIYTALDKFLPGVYEPTDIPGRYTFVGGSTTGGAVIYDDGKFLFSHHATDPTGGRLCNAWDLVRLHKFAELDDVAAPGTPTNRLPSFTAMRELAAKDSETCNQLSRDQYDELLQDFGNVAAEMEEDPVAWLSILERNKDGKVIKTTDNILIILEHDPRLRGRIYLDTFANRGIAAGPFPWDGREGTRIWNDNDDSGLRWYLEKAYQLTGKEKVLDALSMCGTNHGVNPVQDYLENLHWDGVERLDTAVIDYLGAEDNPYTRAVSRKAFTAAVARVLSPGCKFDQMTIFTGPQGIGKSTFLRKMGRLWFSDSLTTFTGKEARELVQGVWIIEVGELTALSKAENEQAKQFISQCEDIFRAAYGHRTDSYPRRCVFFGTSNTKEFLRDKTGGRRFWPVDVGIQPAVKDVFNGLDNDVDQLWAEAVVRYRQGEPLYLAGEVSQRAQEIQEYHREQSAREGIVRDFLEQKVPIDWSRWDLNRRRLYWEGNLVGAGELELVERERVCALEVWCEALGQDMRFIRNADSSEINSIIAMQPGWERMSKVVRFGYCKQQRGFIKKA